MGGANAWCRVSAALTTTLDLFTMLIAMTFNGAYFAAVVAGYVVGAMSFSHLRAKYAAGLRALAPPEGGVEPSGWQQRRAGMPSSTPEDGVSDDQVVIGVADGAVLHGGVSGKDLSKGHSLEVAGAPPSSMGTVGGPCRC